MDDVLHAHEVVAAQLLALGVAQGLHLGRLVVRQFARHAVPAVRQKLLQLVHHVRVPGREERNRRALPPGSPRAPDAVRVVLDDQRHLVVYHQVDALDVDAASGDVGGDQDVVLALLKTPQRLLALILALPAVNSGDAVSHLVTQVGHVVHDALGVDEYDRLGVGVLRQHQLQLRGLLVIRGPLDDLLDEIRGFPRASDVHHRGVAHVFPRQLLHARGHRRGEHVRHAVLGTQVSL